MANEQLNLQRFILTVVIVGITLVLGIYINQTMGLELDAPNTAGSTNNEVGFINSSGYVVNAASQFEFGNLAVTGALNRTSGAAIAAGNYTVNPTSGRITNATAVLWNNVSFNYTYTYTASTEASTASLQVVTALATGTSWISILVVVGFATIILTMLTSGLGNAAREQNGIPYY